jgi:hypothetical protein
MGPQARGKKIATGKKKYGREYGPEVVYKHKAWQKRFTEGCGMPQLSTKGVP